MDPACRSFCRRSPACGLRGLAAGLSPLRGLFAVGGRDNMAPPAPPLTTVAMGATGRYGGACPSRCRDSNRWCDVDPGCRASSARSKRSKSARNAGVLQASWGAGPFRRLRSLDCQGLNPPTLFTTRTTPGTGVRGATGLMRNRSGTRSSARRMFDYVMPWQRGLIAGHQGLILKLQ